METWKEIDGFNGRYMVSNIGRVKSLLGKTPKILKTGINTAGYQMLVLRKDNKNHVRMIHRLVAKAFIPLIPGKDYVNHKDGNKLNNHFSNLEWMTHLENVQHAKDFGLFNRGASHHLSKQVLQVSLDGDEILKVWGSFSDVQRALGYDTGALTKAAKGVYKQAYGFVWRYAE